MIRRRPQMSWLWKSKKPAPEPVEEDPWVYFYGKWNKTLITDAWVENRHIRGRYGIVVKYRDGSTDFIHLDDRCSPSANVHLADFRRQLGI